MDEQVQLYLRKAKEAYEMGNIDSAIELYKRAREKGSEEAAQRLHEIFTKNRERLDETITPFLSKFDLIPTSFKSVSFLIGLIGIGIIIQFFLLIPIFISKDWNLLLILLLSIVVNCVLCSALYTINILAKAVSNLQKQINKK